MSTETGAQLAEGIRAALAEFKAVCAGVDEDVAGRAPAGRWSPKEILSHLAGPDGAGLELFESFLNADTPHIDMVPERTYFTDARRAMSFARLLALVERKYEGVAAYAEGLGGEQLSRKAHIPLFKETPLTEYPTLAALIGGLGQGHVRMHADHLRQVLAELAAN